MGRIEHTLLDGDLLDHGYIERYPNEVVTVLGLYRVTTKGLEEILSNP